VQQRIEIELNLMRPQQPMSPQSSIAKVDTLSAVLAVRGAKRVRIRSLKRNSTPPETLLRVANFRR
jgi:hypothetical protein